MKVIVKETGHCGKQLRNKGEVFDFDQRPGDKAKPNGLPTWLAPVPKPSAKKVDLDQRRKAAENGDTPANKNAQGAD